MVNLSVVLRTIVLYFLCLSVMKDLILHRLFIWSLFVIQVVYQCIFDGITSFFGYIGSVLKDSSFFFLSFCDMLTCMLVAWHFVGSVKTVWFLLRKVPWQIGTRSGGVFKPSTSSLIEETIQTVFDICTWWYVNHFLVKILRIISNPRGMLFYLLFYLNSFLWGDSFFVLLVVFDISHLSVELLFLS